MKVNNRTKGYVEEHRVYEDPYVELANAIVKQAADDYCNAYRGWFATQDTMNTKPRAKVDGAEWSTENAIMLLQHEAERNIRDTIRFLYSEWFGTLTKLNPAALHEGLRRKAQKSSYMREQVKLIEPPPTIKKRKGKTKYIWQSTISVVGEVWEIRDGAIVVKTTQYKYEESPNDFTFKYFVVDLTDFKAPPLELGQEIAVWALIQNNTTKQPLIPINIVTDLDTKQRKFEHAYMDILKEARRV